MYDSAWVIAIAAGLSAGVVLARRMVIRSLSRQRILGYSVEEEPEGARDEDEERGPIGRRLALAGYRAPGAAGRFLTATTALFSLGLVAALVLRRSGLIDQGIRALESIPGAISELFLPVLYASPWAVVVLLASVPWLVVRAARRRLVTAIEQDLPLVLELLATLSDAGLGFDAAIDRIVAGQPSERPLTAELRAFQREVLTGRPRIEALRRVARRVDVPSLTIFISAIVQAEQVGAGVSNVLRRQADDARDRRRDRALTQAQALPVKLVFPLVICFLPAIFVLTLGPVFLQFIRIADTVLNQGTPR
jgi:tight adherence protein C